MPSAPFLVLLGTHDWLIPSKLERILVCSFYLKIYSMKNKLQYAWGLCHNLTSYRFVRYSRVDNTIRLSKQIDIMKVGKLDKSFDQDKLRKVGRNFVAVLFNSDKDLH